MRDGLFVVILAQYLTGCWINKMDALAGVARNCLALFGIVRNIHSYEALNSIAAVRTTVRLFASD